MESYQSTPNLIPQLDVSEQDVQKEGSPSPPAGRKPKDLSWMTENAGQQVYKIAESEVQTSLEPVTSADGHDFLCSYSWKQTEQPTIYVPGTPPKLTLPPLPMQLEKDQGQYWTDQNAYRAPQFQFEPIFQALSTINPNVQFNDVDVVVNRNTLQKFLEFVSSKRGSPFCVDLDIVGTTLFIGRKMKKARTSPNSGYGRSFESQFTTVDPALEDADGHHRAIRYKFGGLDMVVRLEADGYVDHARDDEAVINRFNDVFNSPTQDVTQLVGRFHEVFNTTVHNADQLVERFKHLVEATMRQELVERSGSLRVISPTASSAEIAHEHQPHTKVVCEGTLIPHKQTLEMKSSGSKGGAIEQMWFGRTSYLCLGRQKEGLINDAEVMHIGRDEFQAWEQNHQTNLQKLAWFLGEIRKTVKEKTRDGAAVLVMLEKGAPLRMFEAKKSHGALPKKVVERFWK